MSQYASRRRRPELALDGLPVPRERPPLVPEKVRDGLGERERLLARHDATSGPKTPFSSRPPGLSVDTTGVPARQRFDRDGGQRLEQRRQHEQIRGRAVARDRPLSTRPANVDVPLDAGRPRHGLQLVEQRAGAANDQPRIGMRCGSTSPIASSRKRWPASGCRRLTFTSRCRLPMPSARRTRRLRALVVPREARADRRIDDARRRAAPARAHARASCRPSL